MYDFGCMLMVNRDPSWYSMDYRVYISSSMTMQPLMGYHYTCALINWSVLLQLLTSCDVQCRSHKCSHWVAGGTCKSYAWKHQYMDTSTDSKGIQQHNKINYWEFSGMWKWSLVSCLLFVIWKHKSPAIMQHGHVLVCILVSHLYMCTVAKCNSRQTNWLITAFNDEWSHCFDLSESRYTTLFHLGMTTTNNQWSPVLWANIIRLSGSFA